MTRDRALYVAFLVAIVAGLALVIGGQRFRVRRTEVYGTLLLRSSDVASAAALSGANPFTANTDAVEKRILALGVPVSASVAFVLPDIAVITVVERTPAYIWKVGSTMYLVSSDGTVLGTTMRENERVIVVDASRQPVKVGQRLDVRPFREAAYLMSILPRLTNLSPSAVTYSPDLGVVVPTPEGASIAFGDDQDLPLKLQELVPTLDVAKAQRPPPSLIDLQYPRHPFFR